MTGWLLVVAGAMVGAPLRYYTDRALTARAAGWGGAAFPWGTFTVNTAGSLLLGLVTGAASAGAASAQWQLLLGTGLCGALTTYSTFSYETLRLAGAGARGAALGYAAASVAAGLAGLLLGTALAGAVF